MQKRTNVAEKRTKILLLNSFACTRQHTNERATWRVSRFNLEFDSQRANNYIVFAFYSFIVVFVCFLFASCSFRRVSTLCMYWKTGFILSFSHFSQKSLQTHIDTHIFDIFRTRIFSASKVRHITKHVPIGLAVNGISDQPKKKHDSIKVYIYNEAQAQRRRKKHERKK